MTEQEFIDYMAPYGTHVQFMYGDDIIEKKIHLTPYNSNYTNFPHLESITIIRELRLEQLGI